MRGPIVVYRTIRQTARPDLSWHSTRQVHRTGDCAERHLRVGGCVLRSVVDPGAVPPWRLCAHCFLDYREYSYGLLREAHPHGSGPSYGPDPFFKAMDVIWTTEHPPRRAWVVECGVVQEAS